MQIPWRSPELTWGTLNLICPKLLTVFLFSLRKSLHNAQSIISAVGQFHAISLRLFHTAFISLCVNHFDLIIDSKL